MPVHPQVVGEPRGSDKAVAKADACGLWKKFTQRLFGIHSYFATAGVIISTLVVRFMKTYTLVAPNLACGKARGGRIPRSGSVTDEQRSHRPNSAQPSGRQFFFG